MIWLRDLREGDGEVVPEADMVVGFWMVLAREDELIFGEVDLCFIWFCGRFKQMIEYSE